MIVERSPATSPAAAAAKAEIELGLVLDAVQRCSGYDFREFLPAVLRRRINDRMRAEGASTLSGLQERLFHEPGALERLIDAITFNPSTPFREPDTFLTFREHVLPRLRTFPFVRIWVAGCGAGDDVYGLGMLLREADFEHRVRIYATDACEDAIDRAKSGIVDAASVEHANERYRAAGGNRSFEEYLEMRGSDLTYRASLRENVVFAQHNLATDSSFNEFHVILARTVLAPFGRTLAYRAYGVLNESLIRLGYLALGESDAARAMPQRLSFESVPGSDAFLRKMR